MSMNNIDLGFFLILALTLNTGAARVGVVVSFPNGETITECVDVSDSTDGYEVMQKTGFDIAWSDGGLWGHGLCGIGGVGCPAEDCYCGVDEYWGFHIFRGSGWDYMPVGWDAGDECWSGDFESYDGHYCARDGDVLGYVWGAWGTQPVKKSFGEICPQKSVGGRSRGLVAEINGVVVDKEFSAFSGGSIKMVVKCEEDLEPLNDYTVEVSTDSLRKVSTLESDGEGTVEFGLDEPGLYRLLIVARGRTHEQVMLRIEAETKTTTLTSTSTAQPETTSTTLTTTTIELEHLTGIEEANASTTTSTVEVETSSTLTPDNSTTVVGDSGPNLAGRVVENQGRGSRGGLYAILIAGLVLAGYAALRK